MRTVSLIAVLILLFSGISEISAQTNPTPYDLNTGNYSLSSWLSTQAAGTYPSSMRFHQTPILDMKITDNFDGDWTLGYGLTSRSRINGLGNDGFSFVNTSSTNTGGKWLGAAVLGINTTNRTKIQLSFVAGYVSISGTTTREYRIRAQYRIGTSNPWTDLTDANGNTIEFKFRGYIDDYSYWSNRPYNESFSLELPYTLENQANVQIRWIYYQANTGSGNRPQLKLDDISVTSESSIGSPTNLQISSIDPNTPMSNIPFTAIIRSTDANGIPKYVNQNTNFDIQVQLGTGSFISSTTTGTILAGTNTVVMNNLRYNKNENVTIRVVRTSGDNLTTGTRQITFVEGPLRLEFENVYNKAHVGVSLPPFNVKAVNSNGSLNTNYNNYDITLSVVSGPGTLSGTITKKILSGQVTFDDIKFSAAGNYTIRASGSGVQTFDMAVSVRDLPVLTEILIPEFLKGVGNFGSRVPVYALIELNNLHPGTKYRFLTGARNVGFTFSQTEEGAGNNLHFDVLTNRYWYNSSTNLGTENEYSTFITGPSETSKKFWINLVPTTNSTFNEGNDVYWILTLGNENGNLIQRYATTNTSRALEFGATSPRATGIADANSMIQPKNFICLYSSTTSTMPLSTAIVQDDEGILMDGLDSFGNPFPPQGPTYYNDLDRASGSWATILPNKLRDGFTSTSVKRIEEYSPNGTLRRVWTDEDGVWNGINTNSPTGGVDQPIIQFETPQLFLTSLQGVPAICNDAPHRISWTSHGVGMINVQLSTNGGSSWFTILENVAATPNYYHWEVPRNIYSNIPIRMKIFSVEHPYVESQSTDFTIYDSPIILSQTHSSILCYNTDGQIQVVATGSLLTYQWQLDGVDISGATSPVYLIDNIKFSQSGVYNCIVSGAYVCPTIISEDILVYAITDPRITKQPESQVSDLGGTVSIEVQAHIYNTGAPIEKLDYQWYRGSLLNPLSDDDRIAGANSSILTIKGITNSDYANDYFVVCSGLCGSVQSENFSISAKPSVNITAQPTDISVCLGALAQFDVTAIIIGGGSTLTYQWYKDGVMLVDGGRISGANSASLLISNTEQSDLGKYKVKVTVNPGDASAESNEAQITIKEETRITSQTESLTATTGRELKLEVTASGAGTLRYQWFKNGQAIPNETNSSFVVPSATQTDAGQYYCSVSADCGEAQSRIIEVTVQLNNVTDVDDDAISGGDLIVSIQPNPVEDNMNVNYLLAESGKCELFVTDLRGEWIATLFIGSAKQGLNTISFNQDSLSLTSGVYILNLKSSRGIISTKFIKLP